MLFNSASFLFVFLPVVFAGFFLLGRLERSRPAIGWLVFASFVFYGWFHVSYLLLFGFSILFNYGLSTILAGQADPSTKGRNRGFLILGIAVNLGLIGYYKYFNFFIDSANRLFASDWMLMEVLLPIGISFFTFQQVAFLVDRYAGRVDHPPLTDYCLFVAFFPQLVAGPIVHHSDVMPQFSNSEIYRFRPNVFVGGLTIFLLGLCKKVVLADQFAVYANRTFEAAADGARLTLFEAWGGALSYSFQLYFDFSGYSDMAIGLAGMVGIQLPLNFNSPYKATSIIDFWRRWHITLSRFLRDYLYIPLGGGRSGTGRRYVNLMTTMLLGGLWHGAGWTFVFWGFLHGFYLVVNHAWNWLCERTRVPSGVRDSTAYRALGWTLTMTAVVVGWVFFRAESFAAARAVVAGMAGLNGAALPSQFVNIIPGLKQFVASLGNVPFLADGTVMGLIEMSVLLMLAGLIVVFGRHLHEMPARARLYLLVPAFAFTLQRVLFKADAAQFIYFQF
jgi:alginate O-acetyltransferase complex protein AlgI